MNNSQKIAYAVLVALVLLFAWTSASFYRKYADLKQNPQKATEETISKLVAEIGQIIVLPEGEAPTVATVTDPEKLRDQQFFSKAEAGDKVLIYTNARKAILYHPLAKKIIEVAPVNIGNPAPSSQPAQPAAE